MMALQPLMFMAGLVLPRCRRSYRKVRTAFARNNTRTVVLNAQQHFLSIETMDHASKVDDDDDDSRKQLQQLSSRKSKKKERFNTLDDRTATPPLCEIVVLDIDQDRDGKMEAMSVLSDDMDVDIFSESSIQATSLLIGHFSAIGG